MGTQCTVHFHYASRPEPDAIVYRHWDGYPKEVGMLGDLQRFFDAVEEQTTDRRFGDPSYLAAKFIVWQANEYRAAGGILDFLSVGTTLVDPGDISYRYHVWCNGARPDVTWEKARREQ